MDKLIIENRTNLTMIEATRYAIKVMELGRISKGDTQYCYITTFKDIVVYAGLNKRSDRLVISEAKQHPTKKGKLREV